MEKVGDVQGCDDFVLSWTGLNVRTLSLLIAISSIVVDAKEHLIAAEKLLEESERTVQQARQETAEAIQAAAEEKEPALAAAAAKLNSVLEDAAEDIEDAIEGAKKLISDAGEFRGGVLRFPSPCHGS